MTFYFWKMWGCVDDKHHDSYDDTSVTPDGSDVIGLWQFSDGATKTDTGIGDGIRQNGDFENGAGAHGGYLKTDGYNDYFSVESNATTDAPFDLDSGTVSVEFTQDCHVGSSPDTIVSRGEYCDKDKDGYFEISVTKEGAVQAYHYANGKMVHLKTEDGFFDEKDDIAVAYSWDKDEGAMLKVVNKTDGTEANLTSETKGLDFDITDNDDESFTFGARESDDGQYDRFFDGKIDYVEVRKSVMPDMKPDGTVFGTDGDDVIDDTYVDTDGDMIDSGDAIIPGHAPNDDLVVAGDGNDVVYAGEGDDTIYGGPGDDTINGGDGNDIIYGDKDLGGIETVRESFEWDKLPDPDDGGKIDEGDRILNVTQNTGSVNVSFEKTYASSYKIDHDYTDVNQNIGGIDGGSETVDSTSGFQSDLSDTSYGKASYKMGFDKPVDDVQFRVNDIDGSGKVIIKAYDASGNPVPVSFTYGDGLKAVGSDGVETKYQNSYGDEDSSKFSTLVNIAGPVSKITIEHSEGYYNSAVTITDVYFDVPGEAAVDGAGDDVLFGDNGDDEIYGGAGNDTLDGGDGSDEMYGGDGDDRIIGGAGNDIAYGGDGNDIMDDVEGESDDNPGEDSYYGGSGDDEIWTGWGDDYIEGGIGNDTLGGEDGDDEMYGGEGDDTLRGGSGNDMMFGGDGNDRFSDGNGDDVAYGGDGEDVFYAGRGNDTLYGGMDSDTFFGGNGGDEIYGGDGPDTDGDGVGDETDTLDLTGGGWKDGEFKITYTSADREDGFVTYSDGSTLTFEEIENIMPCFTPGTTIATPRGEMLVENLREGDRIITRDNGIQEIRWIGHKKMAGADLVKNPHLKPVLIKAGSLGAGLPERDMLVSPNHRVLVANDKTQLYFEEREVLASAKHLVGAQGIHRIDVMATTYIHFMFDQHEVVLSNGSWTESFQPGDHSLKGIGNSQRQEIFELFPELRDREGLENYTSARKSLKKHEARLLAE